MLVELPKLKMLPQLYVIIITSIIFGACFAKFPSGIIFGASTSAYQIEGAWNDDDKGESIWDRFTHKYPNQIIFRYNGDVACDSYHNYENDVKILKDIGADFYRFSFSWSRILPKGFGYKISESGLSYYNNLINLLVKNDIRPMATIFHWDLPQVVQDLGGFSNELIVDWFEDYAKILFEAFGDRVKLWITISDPQTFCLDGYGSHVKPPGVNMSQTATYMCAHNILKSHARAYHLYNDKFRMTQNGEVGIALETYGSELGTLLNGTLSSDIQFDWFAEPIFGQNGDYPVSLKAAVGQQSTVFGFQKSQLPLFTQDEIIYLKGSYDFCAITYCHGWVDMKFSALNFRKSLNHIKTHYGNPKIYVVANGLGNDEKIKDQMRIKYLQAHLDVLENAINEDEVNVAGYAVWSLLDNFDWNNGYTSKYGLYYVNFTDPERPRVVKDSANFYRKFIVKKKLQMQSTVGSSVLNHMLLLFPILGSVIY